MKQLRLFFTGLIFLFILVSCGGNAQGNAIKDHDQVTSASSGPDVEANFSCMLDGKEVAGKGTDQNINAAFHLTGDDKGQVFFRLSDINNVGDKLMFQLPAKEGATTFASPSYSYVGYSTSDFANYIDDPITVTINSINPSRITGTFSGKYSLQKGSGNNNTKQAIEVRDGKFDIPFSTSADWKKLYHAE